MRKPRLGKNEALKGKRVAPLYLWKRHREFPSMTSFSDIREADFASSLTKRGRSQGQR